MVLMSMDPVSISMRLDGLSTGFIATGASEDEDKTYSTKDAKRVFTATIASFAGL